MTIKLPHTRQPARLHRQEGSSLIEILVSIVLLTFGILGVAGLQLVGTKSNHGSYLRSQAVSLAYDVADRMRGNLVGLGATGDGYNTDLATLYSAANGPACGGVLGVVSAVSDVNQWKSCLETQLPLGRGIVTPIDGGTDYVDQCDVTHAAHNTVGRRLIVIEVVWDNSRIANEANVTAANPNLECVVVRTDLLV